MSRAQHLFSALELSAEVKKLAIRGEQIEVVYSKKGEEMTALFDKVLVAIGRRPETEAKESEIDYKATHQPGHMKQESG